MKKINFKMPSAFTILFSIIVAVAVLTWIVPAGAYDYVDPSASKLEPIAGTYHAIEQNPQGIWEIMNAPIAGFYDAVDIALFVIVIGGFLGIVVKTGAIDAGVGRVVKKLNGKEQIMIPILMILFGLGGTVYGMCEETIAFYPLIIPVIIAAGYDAITAVSIVALGAGLGVLGSTVNPFATGIASGFAGISLGEGIGVRLLILVVVELIGIIFVMRYAKKVKADPSKSLVAHMKKDNEQYFLKGNQQEVLELSSKRKTILWLFGLSFGLMVLSVIPWAYKFDILIFENFNNWLMGIPVIGSLVGKPVPLGDWWFGEITMLFLVMGVIVGLIYRMSEKEITSTFVNGARDLLGVALIIGLSRGITVVMNDGGMTATVLHWGEQTLAKMGDIGFINFTYLFYLPMSFLVPSTSGLATLTMPIMAPLGDFADVSRDLVVTAYQSASGVVNLITPTSATIMGALAIARVPYGTYFKHIWKLLIVLSVVIMLILTVATCL